MRPKSALFNENLFMTSVVNKLKGYTSWESSPALFIRGKIYSKGRPHFERVSFWKGCVIQGSKQEVTKDGIHVKMAGKKMEVYPFTLSEIIYCIQTTFEVASFCRDQNIFITTRIGPSCSKLRHC